MRLRARPADAVAARRRGPEFPCELDGHAFYVNFGLPGSLSQGKTTKILNTAHNALPAGPEVRTTVTEAQRTAVADLPAAPSAPEATL